MNTIAIYNRKGGVGKTTTTFNLGWGLAREGYRVLLIDLDPQANLTESAGISPDPDYYSIKDVLMKKTEIQNVTADLDGIDLAIATDELRDTAASLLNPSDGFFRLKKALEPIHPLYDYVLIDCPPTSNRLTDNALVASDYVLIPVQAEFLAAKGLEKIVQDVATVQEYYNESLEILGAFVTVMDRRETMSRDILQLLRDKFGSHTLETHIRKNTDLSQAQRHAESIFEYKEKSAGAQDYKQLTLEIIKRTQHEKVNQ